MTPEVDPAVCSGSEGITVGAMLFGHDASYSFLDSKGSPVLVAEEERYSRRKKGTFIPSPKTFFRTLAEAGFSPGDVRHLALVGIPSLMERRAPVSRGDLLYGPAKCNEALQRAICHDLPELETVQWVRHHLCHAASAFFACPFPSAAVVTVDGMGEVETATIWHGNGTRLEKKLEIPHPHSIGYLYQNLALWMGLTGGEREGKLMGLASHGEPRYLDVLKERFLAPCEDGTFRLVPGLEALRCANTTWLDYSESVFGPRRAPTMPIQQFHRDIAASIQALTEEVLLSFTRLAQRITGESRCCMAGGVFMNSMANGRIRREGPFDEVWVQPLASDNGLSLGAALWSAANRSGPRPSWHMTDAFLGSDVTEAEIILLHERHGLTPRRSKDVEKEVAGLLAAGRIVGWVQGRAEVGARALGHRSILADARTPGMKDKINYAIKLREDWRPFAPIVLREEMKSLFSEDYASPFMMFVSNARSGAPIPAALHVDGSARVQTVSDQDDPRLRRLLVEFKALTNVGGLLNTSFNVRGEPIVRTAEQAYRIFAGSGMDVLVLGDYIIEKSTDACWNGVPIEAEPPPIRLSSRLEPMTPGNGRIVIVELGGSRLTAAALERLQIAAPGRCELVRVVGAREMADLPLVDVEGAPVSIESLADAGLVLLLLPVWTSVALELISRLLAPFLAALDPYSVVLIDEDEGLLTGEELASSWARVAPDGTRSEVENHWVRALKSLNE